MFRGSNPQIDHALSKISSLRTFLKQDMKEKALYKETLSLLTNIISEPLG